MTIRTLAYAESVAGTLGFPSKMPGTSYGIPAQACHTGGKLQAVAGSTCSLCYADDRGRYGAQSVKLSQANRLAKLAADQWAEAMIFMLRRAHGLDGGQVHRKIKDAGAHRWHDSGDIQSPEHFDAICAVAAGTPELMHWLPTREAALLSSWCKARGATLADINSLIPANLCVRVSATMIDGPPSAVAPNTSTVHDASPAQGHQCPAPRQGGVCGACRACWDRSVPNTSYHVH